MKRKALDEYFSISNTNLKPLRAHPVHSKKTKPLIGKNRLVLYYKNFTKSRDDFRLQPVHVFGSMPRRKPIYEGELY